LTRLSANAAPGCRSSPLLQNRAWSTASCAIGKASAAKRRILSNPALRRAPTPALGNDAQHHTHAVRMPTRCPSGRGVPEHLCNFERPTRNSGPTANCRAEIGFRAAESPAIRCLPRVLPGFPSFPPRFPLCSRIETLISFFPVRVRRAQIFYSPPPMFYVH
jgi:hypothetical protein